MKKFLILLIYLMPFSVSQAQDSTMLQAKKWCLAVNQQNKDLFRKVSQKDSVIHAQNAVIIIDNENMASYERDFQAYKDENKAYREALVRKDTIISVKKEIIRGLRKQIIKERVGGGAIILTLFLLLVL